MIGDLITDKTDSVWLYYLKIQDLMDILLQTKFDDNDLFKLADLIQEINSSYLALFHDNVKPKFHNLVHYPRIIRESGPPRFYSSFRFEAKHKDHKGYCHAITSRKNILLTMSIKSMLRFVYYFIFTTKRNDITLLPSHVIQSNFRQIISGISKSSCTSYNCVKYFGTEYKISYHLPAQKDDKLYLYEIQEICIFATDKYIIGEQVAELIFDESYHCHLVVQCQTQIVYKQIQEFKSLPINIIPTPSAQYVKLKSYFHSK